MMTRRGHCYEFRSGDNLAFLNWHALARLGERCKIDILDAGGIVSVCGVVGLLMRESAKHCGSELNLAFTDMLLTGTLRYVASDTSGRWHAFFDCLTTLEHNDSPRRKLQLRQGAALAHMALKYIKGDNADPVGWADKISVLPFHESDYVSRELVQKNLALPGVAPMPSTG
jgi:hypothetical protein